MFSTFITHLLLVVLQNISIMVHDNLLICSTIYPQFMICNYTYKLDMYCEILCISLQIMISG